MRAVANDIDVRLRLERTDTDIAQDAARALRLLSTLPEGVQAAVHNGRVTLTGTVQWLFQKESAEQAVRHIHGVRKGHQLYQCRAPGSVARDVRHRIVKALHENADVDARHIHIVAGDTATLTRHGGDVVAARISERASANAPGIAHVENRITVQPSRELAVDDLDEIC